MQPELSIHRHKVTGSRLISGKSCDRLVHVGVSVSESLQPGSGISAERMEASLFTKARKGEARALSDSVFACWSLGLPKHMPRPALGVKASTESFHPTLTFPHAVGQPDDVSSSV